MIKRFLVTLTLILTYAAVVDCQTTGNACADFQRTIRETYNFKPSKLSEAQRNAKVASLDRVWNMVKARQDELLPCLRRALEDPQADPFFRFDGSTLLVSLDPSTASKTIQVKSYAAIDLDDIDLQVWVMALALRGSEGFDVSEAGARWLAYPNAKYYLPEHGAHEVNAYEGALFIYGSMDEAQATPALLKIINQPNHPGREIALRLLVSQATPEALRALRQIDTSGFSHEARESVRAFLQHPHLIETRAHPKTSREQFLRAFESFVQGDSQPFMELVDSVPDGERDVVTVMKPEDMPLIRKVRRTFIANANQHAIEFYDTFTEILMTLMLKQGAAA